MNSTFKFLGLGACMTACILTMGCSTGDDDDDNTGGTPGVGGAPGSGGSSGGATSKATTLFGFDSGTDDFTFNTVANTDPMYVNLAAAPVSDPPPEVGWGSTRDFGNDSSSGSLRIAATFTSWNQSVSVEVNAPTDSIGAPVDFTNKLIRARLFVEGTGLSPFMDAPGGVIFYVKTGTDYVWGQAPWKNIESFNSWIEVRLDTTAPDRENDNTKPGWDPSDPKQMGFQISSGGGNMHTADEYEDPLPTVIYIDHITVETKP